MLEKVLGRHVICEFRNINKELLDDKDLLVSILVDACKKGNAGILGHIEHRFTPHGVTILILLSESHCSIHTWPEKEYAAMDIFTCGDHVDPLLIFNFIHRKLKGRVYFSQIDRGLPYLENMVSVPEYD